VTRVAAIDCGTNSIRLLVADVAPAADGRGTALTEVLREMRIVRLGQGVDRTGRLAPEAIERTRAALADYVATIAELGVARVRMVATSASRDAANADEFRAMVRRTLSREPEVVTGDEEARLSFAGAVRALPADARPPYLVFDIGGGSTELVRGTTGVQAAVSVDVGCVRMTERHLHGDPPGAAEVAAAEADITRAVDRALATVVGPPGHRFPGTLIGLAGSVTTVAAIALGLSGYDAARIHHTPIAYADVAKVAADLLAATRAQRLANPVIHPGRADVLAAGALILRVIMQRTGAESVLPSDHDILDGIALGLAARG
jgi:exopolyphosphatase / guanosine-5'-triphosphate,3'-diphosphate pyrophosphatase